jgi:CRP-like cAMP-binding protein
VYLDTDEAPHPLHFIPADVGGKQKYCSSFKFGTKIIAKYNMRKLINTISNYITVSEEDIQVIEQLFSKKELKENDYLLKSGNVCQEYVFVDKGLLRHCINNDGKEVVYYFSAESDFVCDYESFISRTSSVKSIIAMEDTVVFSISYNNLQQFYSKIPNGEKFGRLYLESVFSKTINHIVSTFTESAEQRYLDFLTTFKHIQHRIPQYYIASFIGVTPQSLSRIRKQLVKK